MLIRLGNELEVYTYSSRGLTNIDSNPIFPCLPFMALLTYHHGLDLG